MSIHPEKINTLFARWDRPDSPGLAVGVIRDGELAYQRGYGMADLDHGIPIGPDTKFFIASMTKQFVAACIHLLALDGKLSLDDDVRSHVPEIPDYGRPIAIRKLLYHTSGLREYTAMLSLAGRRPLQDYLDNGDVLRLLARQHGLNAPPGAEHAYSNSGYVLLAVIVERVSGMPLRDFCRVRIFEPLGMADTELDDDFTRILRNRATSYRPAPDGFRRFVKSYDVYGDAGLWSTVGDLARWDRNFYDPVVGGREWVARMLEPGRLADGTPLHYASALARWRYRGLDALIHGGLAMGFRSQMIRFPAQRTTVICLMNVLTASTTDLCQQIADICLADRFPEPAPAVDFSHSPGLEVLENLTGAYLDRQTGLNADVWVRDGRLWIDLLGAQAPLGPLSPPVLVEPALSLPRGKGAGESGAFRILGGPMLVDLRFERADPAAAWQLHVFAEMHTLPVMAQTAVEALSVEQLRGYEGRYFSEELEVIYDFEVRGQTLTVSYPDRPPMPLKTGPADVFRAQSDSYCFERDAARRVVSFLMQVPQARNIRFVRQP